MFPTPTLQQEFLSAFGTIWYLWVPLLIGLLGVGWATRKSVGSKLLFLSLILLAAFTTRIYLRERSLEQQRMSAWNKLRVPLPAAARIDGLQLKAGTIVRWNSENPGHLLTAELGAGQEVFPGIVLVGEVDNFVDRFISSFWQGTLNKPTRIRGWNCGGKVNIDFSGLLLKCLLAVDQTTPAGTIPAGTAISLDLNDPSEVQLNLPGTGMRVFPINIWIAPYEWFSLYPDGELLSLPGPIQFRGVTFGGGVALRYGEEDVSQWYGYDPTRKVLPRPPGKLTGWRGDLASPLLCEGGRTLATGARVTIPTEGDLVTTVDWDGSVPVAKHLLDSLHCNLPAPK